MIERFMCKLFTRRKAEMAMRPCETTGHATLSGEYKSPFLVAERIPSGYHAEKTGRRYIKGFFSRRLTCDFCAVDLGSSPCFVFVAVYDSKPRGRRRKQCSVRSSPFARLQQCAKTDGHEEIPCHDTRPAYNHPCPQTEPEWSTLSIAPRATACDY